MLLPKTLSPLPQLWHLSDHLHHPADLNYVLSKEALAVVIVGKGVSFKLFVPYVLYSTSTLARVAVPYIFSFEFFLTVRSDGPSVVNNPLY